MIVFSPSYQLDRAYQQAGESRHASELLGFVWDPHATSWEKCFLSLEIFRQRERHVVCLKAIATQPKAFGYNSGSAFNAAPEMPCHQSVVSDSMRYG